RDRELLGADAIDAALDEHLAQPVLHRGPVALELLLGLDLLAVEVLGDPRRLGAERHAERVGERMGGIGREDGRAAAGGRAAARCGRGHRRLPHAALAGVENDPGCQARGAYRRTRHLAAATVVGPMPRRRLSLLAFAVVCTLILGAC